MGFFDQVIDTHSQDAEDYKPRVAIMGVGGGGCNTISRLAKIGIAQGIPLMAANTDKKQLNAMADRGIKKLLLGKTITRGLGAGGDPNLAQKAALNSKKAIKEAVEGIDLLFLASGMGGGTGTGATPVIAQIARDMDCIVCAFVTYPFKLERARLAKAKKGINELKESADTTVIIDNNRLAEYAPHERIEKAFALVDEITAKAIKGITDTIMLESLINLDFADLKSVLAHGGVGAILIGEGAGPHFVEDAIENTLTNKLLDVDTTGSSGALVHLTGGPDMTLGDANELASRLTQKVSDDASVILGARTAADFSKRVEAMAIYTGLKDKYTLG